MDSQSRILVAGHRGLVGSAILRRLQAAGYEHIITRTHGECDLENQGAFFKLFLEGQPEIVNVGTGEDITIHELAEGIRTTYQWFLGHQAEVRV